MSYSRRGMERLGQLLDDIATRLVSPPESIPLPHTTLDRAVQRAESIARRLFLLPQLPSDMATVTTSIGTTGRDYSTITSWEADLDNSGIYSAADDAVGECYADSAFDESPTINGGGTVGLNSITLSVAEGERHDGTAGSGARMVMSGANKKIQVAVANATVEWLEIDQNGFSYVFGGVYVSTDGPTVQRMIMHNMVGSGASLYGLGAQGAAQIHDNIIYDVENSGASSSIVNGIGTFAQVSDNVQIKNNTVHDIRFSHASNTNNPKGIFRSTGTVNSTNNVVTGVTTAGSGSSECFSGTQTQSYNLSSDATASGTGSLTSKSASNQFVSIVGGSEDLHLKTGADAIDAGTDLGTTPTGIEVDINGRDRDANGDTWDMGAHEFVSAGGGTSSGVASLVLAAAIAAGSATFSSTSHTGSASLSSPAAITDASATSTSPAFSASAALNSPAAIESAAATFVPPVFTAAASLGTSPAIATGSAAFAAAIFSASAALETGSSTVVASAATTTPTFDASAALITPASIGAGAAMFAAEIYTGSAALDVPASVASGTASFSSASTGTADLIASSAIVSATATFAEPTYQATASLVVAAPVVTATDISGNPIPFYYQFLLAAGTN